MYLDLFKSSPRAHVSVRVVGHTPEKAKKELEICDYVVMQQAKRSMTV
jgi:hypothetical protein